MKAWRALLSLSCSLLLLTLFNSPICAAQSPAISGTSHLLVVIPEGAKQPHKSALVAQLAKLPPQDWLISVARADETVTPYLRLNKLRMRFA